MLPAYLIRMLQLSVVHCPKGSTPHIEPAHAQVLRALAFETCQRLVWIDPQGLVPGASHQGEAAYSFLLEVICGLHSRVFGETEVLGQFKAFCRQHPELEPVGSWLLEDAKAIRSRHLTGIGSQSYGSVVRRWCGEQHETLILGRGQLAQKIQPWIPDARQSGSRDLEQCRKAVASLSPRSRVVIAAPINDSALTELKQIAPSSTLWIDLRGDRAGFEAHHTLEDLFRELESDQQHSQKLLPVVREEIRKRSRSRADRMVCRPMGWEDLA